MSDAAAGDGGGDSTLEDDLRHLARHHDSESIQRLAAEQLIGRFERYDESDFEVFDE